MIERNKVKISVVVPVYNNYSTLRACIESIANQTLKDIEIIIVNDGSRDGSLNLAMELAEQDNRIAILNITNHGTGYAINYGIQCASGEYIGQVDADDTIEPNMYERLYEAAKNADIVKAGYNAIIDGKTYKCEIYGVTKEDRFCPRELPYIQRINFFGWQPSFWSGIYKRSFIEKNELYWNETAGASFQDTSATFRANAMANEVVLIPGCYYNWIRNNASSTGGTKYPYAIIHEYESIMSFLNERPKLWRLRKIACFMQYNGFRWNYGRIANIDKRAFAHEAAAVLKNCDEDIDVRYWAKSQYEDYIKWVTDPEAWHTERVEYDTRRIEKYLSDQ